MAFMKPISLIFTGLTVALALPAYADFGVGQRVPAPTAAGQSVTSTPTAPFTWTPVTLPYGMNGTGQMAVGGTVDTTTRFTVAPQGTAENGVSVTMPSSPTGNAFQVKNSTGSLLFKVASNQTGDIGSTPLIQGYNAGVETSRISYGGSCFVGSIGAISSGSVYTHFQFVPGSRTNVNYPLWFPGGNGITLFGPTSGGVSLACNNNGSVVLSGGSSSGAPFGLTANSWTTNNHLLDFYMPSGSQRSYVGNFGNLAVQMYNNNGGSGWDTTNALSVDVQPASVYTGNLAQFAVNASIKASVGPTGSVSAPAYNILSGGTTTPGITVTVPLAKLTTGGTNGSLTFTGGILTASTNPT